MRDSEGMSMFSVGWLACKVGKNILRIDHYEIAWYRLQDTMGMSAHSS